MKIASRLFRNALPISVLLCSSPAPAQQFEQPPTLRAQQLVPATLISGAGFHVNDLVPTDGLLAHFTIQSDVGVFPANSEEMLKVRVAEIPAII